MVPKYCGYQERTLENTVTIRHALACHVDCGVYPTLYSKIGDLVVLGFSQINTN